MPVPWWIYLIFSATGALIYKWGYHMGRKSMRGVANYQQGFGGNQP